MQFKFEVHEMKVGRGYYVRMIPPIAVATNINDFANEHDAETWIAQKNAAAISE
jgi:hypothetical protein